MGKVHNIINPVTNEEFRREVRELGGQLCIRHKNKLYIVQKVSDYQLFRNNPKIVSEVYEVVKEAEVK